MTSVRATSLGARSGGKRQGIERQRPVAHQAKQERKTAVEHSPFAALEALRGRLATRQPEGS